MENHYHYQYQDHHHHHHHHHHQQQQQQQQQQQHAVNEFEFDGSVIGGIVEQDQQQQQEQEQQDHPILISHPGPFDVVCGVGNMNNNGNKYYRCLIDKNYQTYQAQNSKKEKGRITQDIISSILVEKGGRFLRERPNKEGGMFEVVTSPDDIREKVSHALRSTKDKKTPKQPQQNLNNSVGPTTNDDDENEVENENENENENEKNENKINNNNRPLQSEYCPITEIKKMKPSIARHLFQVFKRQQEVFRKARAKLLAEKQQANQELEDQEGNRGGEGTISTLNNDNSTTGAVLTLSQSTTTTNQSKRRKNADKKNKNKKKRNNHKSVNTLRKDGGQNQHRIISFSTNNSHSSFTDNDDDEIVQNQNQHQHSPQELAALYQQQQNRHDDDDNDDDDHHHHHTYSGEEDRQIIMMEDDNDLEETIEHVADMVNSLDDYEKQHQQQEQQHCWLEPALADFSPSSPPADVAISAEINYNTVSAAMIVSTQGQTIHSNNNSNNNSSSSTMGDYHQGEEGAVLPLQASGSSSCDSLTDGVNFVHL